jgi:serine/threonine protein phosphatase PrpC
VYDGHGGARASEYCVRELHSSLFKQLPPRLSDTLRGGDAASAAATEPLSDEAVQRSLKEAFAKTERVFIADAQREGQGDGTTATVILIEPATSRLFAAQLGDSRAVLGQRIGPDWQAVALTKDHKPQDPEEKRRVEAVGGEVVFLGCWRVSHPDSASYLACSRAIGDLALKVHAPVVSAEPDVTVRTLDRAMDSLVVVASDGVWDVLSDSEAVEIAARAIAEALEESGDAEERAKEPALPPWAMPGVKPEGEAAHLRRGALAVVREALERGSEDNITAVVMGLDWPRRGKPGA